MSYGELNISIVHTSIKEFHWRQAEVGTHLQSI